MKNLIIIFSLIFLLSSCFLGGKVEENSFNVENSTLNIKEDFVKKQDKDFNISKKIVNCLDIVNGVKENNNLKIQKIFVQYNRIKKNYSSGSLLKELSKELNLTEGFALKKCDIIKENYGRELCKIYVSGDYSKLDTFKFEGGENKKETILMFDSLKQGKVLQGAKEKIITPILEWNYLGKNIIFKFNNSKDTFRIDYYVYLKKNGKEKFLKELNKQFLDVCKKLNNEN